MNIARSLALAGALAFVPAPTAAQTKAAPSAGAQSKAAPSAGAQSKAAPSAGAQSKAAPSASAAPSAAPSAATPAPPTDDVSVWFAKGSAAHEAARYAEAEELFLKVWAVKKAWDVAANLGLAEANLGKFVPAADHLTYALKWFPASESVATKQVLERRLAAARTEVGIVIVTVNVDGAAVRIRNESKGPTPIDGEVFVTPGAVTVEVQKAGYDAVRRTVTVSKGTTEKVNVALTPTAPPAPSRLPAYIAFGAGGVGLIMGAVAGGVAAAMFGDVKKVCSQDLVCPQDQRGSVDSVNVAAGFSTAGFVLAGVGAAAGAALLFLPRLTKTPASTAVVASPSFIGVKGAF